MLVCGTKTQARRPAGTIGWLACCISGASRSRHLPKPRSRRESSGRSDSHTRSHPVTPASAAPSARRSPTIANRSVAPSYSRAFLDTNGLPVFQLQVPLIDRSGFQPGSLLIADRIEEVGKKQPVDREPGGVRNLDRGLFDHVTPVMCPLADGFVEPLRKDQFDQLHGRDRIEDMESVNPIGKTRIPAEVGDRKGRGGGCQVGTRGGFGDPLQQFHLGVVILDDRFDQQVRIREISRVERGRDQVRR